ncbi:RHS repeat domain-containing protein [Neogemmobacter tilapiae]
MDHIGKPVFATNSLGTKVWQVSYDPFGGVVASTGTPEAIRFPGQWFQSESGLHQNWMRDYDPTTGRYLQADPLGLVDGASVYGYARGNPGRYSDPRGEQVEGAVATGIGLAILDGPLPLSDIAGICVIGAAVAYCALGNCSPNMDDCEEQYQEDRAWCADNASGREYIGCLSRAEDKFFTCKRGGPRKPRVPEVYEQ